MKRIIKALSLCLLVGASDIYPRSINTPLPYVTGMYGWVQPDRGLPQYCGLDCSKNIEDDEYHFSINSFAMAYYRTASTAYDGCSFGTKHNLSYIFHGADLFKAADLFEDSALPTDNLMSESLSLISFRPQYQLSEEGFIMGLDALRDYDICGKKYTFGVQVRLPFKNLNVSNVSSISDSINVASQGQLGTRQIQSQVFEDNLFNIINGPNNTEGFAVRMDYAFEQGIAKIVEQQIPSIYVISGALDVVTTTPTFGQISVDQIQNGSAKTKTAGTCSFPPVTAIVNNQTFTANATNYTSVNTSAAFQNGTGIIPLMLYQDGSETKNVLASSNQRLFSTINAPTNIIALQNVYYSDAYTGDLYSNPQATNYSFPIAAAPQNTAGLDIPTSVTWTQPPVVFQKAVDGRWPDEFFIKVTPGTNSEQSNGLYSSDDYSGWTTDSQAPVAVLGSKAEFLNYATQQEHSTATVAVALPEIDYGKISASQDKLKHIYMTTSVDNNGTPMPGSNAVLAQLKQIRSGYPTQSDSIANVSYEEALAIAKNFVSGAYVKGVNNVNQPNDPVVPSYQWGSFSNRGIGDLEMTFTAGHCWQKHGLLGNVLLGLVMPTADQVSPLDNYLGTSIGNNGHVELKAGLQGAYDVSSWFRFAATGVYSWALDATESIIVPFKGAKAFGLQPLVADARISWQQLVATADITIFPAACCGVDVGYQYMLKKEDKICICDPILRDGLGTIDQTVSTDLMSQMSKRQAQKLKSSIFCGLTENCTFTFGYDMVFAGQNIGAETDIYAAFSLQY